jgi:hypothetical protein
MNTQNIATAIVLLFVSSLFWWLFSMDVKKINSPEYKDKRGFWIFILVMQVFCALLMLFVGVVVLFSNKPQLRHPF